MRSRSPVAILRDALASRVLLRMRLESAAHPEERSEGRRLEGWPRVPTTNKNPALRRGFRFRLCRFGLRWNSRLFLVRLPQHVAAAPHRLDVVLAVRGVRQLLAKLADEHVDDLQFGLVHAAVEMIEEHLLGERGALAEREQLQHLVFLACEVHALAADLDRLGVEVDHEIAG